MSELLEGELFEVAPAGLSASAAHHCHARGCERAVPPKLLMCGRHWGMVPRALQRAVWAAYRPGQEVSKDPSKAYLDAARAAIEAVFEKEKGGKG